MNEWVQAIMKRVEEADKKTRQDAKKQDRLIEKSTIYFRLFEDMASGAVAALRETKAKRFENLEWASTSVSSFYLYNRAYPTAKVEVETGGASLRFTITTVRDAAALPQSASGSIAFTLDESDNLIATGNLNNNDFSLSSIDQALDFVFQPVMGI